MFHLGSASSQRPWTLVRSWTVFHNFISPWSVESMFMQFSFSSCQPTQSLSPVVKIATLLSSFRFTILLYTQTNGHNILVTSNVRCRLRMDLEHVQIWATLHGHWYNLMVFDSKQQLLVVYAIIYARTFRVSVWSLGFEGRLCSYMHGFISDNCSCSNWRISHWRKTLEYM